MCVCDTVFSWGLFSEKVLSAAVSSYEYLLGVRVVTLGGDHPAPATEQTRDPNTASVNST